MPQKKGLFKKTTIRVAALSRSSEQKYDTQMLNIMNLCIYFASDMRPERIDLTTKFVSAE